MIEGTNILRRSPVRTLPGGESEHTVETVALAGAAAIERLIAERDLLKLRANAQQRDLVALSKINEDFRRCIALVRHNYLELGTKILAQVEQFDEVIRDATSDDRAAAEAPNDDAKLIALAHRLKPNTGRTS
jgi:hypothetical protein